MTPKTDRQIALEAGACGNCMAGYYLPSGVCDHCGLRSPLEFKGFPKISRLNRDCLVSEKLDGTNAQILITEDGDFLTGSRNRWLTPDDDNFGFARWAQERKEELLKLGPGRHFGEFWGKGIQRGYGLQERRFSLFNTVRWCRHDEEPQIIPSANPVVVKWQERLPSCVGLVPVLREGSFRTSVWESAFSCLAQQGSVAAPGFMNPEGIVVHHIAANVSFKITFDGDGPKGVTS